MAETSYPWNPGDPGGAADLNSWNNIMRALGPGGVLLGEGAECIITAPGGFQIAVGTGKVSGAGHYYENSATKTVALVANATGGIRYDRAVIRFDMQNRTAVALVAVGDNVGPPPLLTDLTDKYDINLGVIAVAVGTPSIGTGNLTPALDRWAVSVNDQGRIGVIDDYSGTIASLSKLYAACYGQLVSRWSYEKLWNVWPTMGGVGVPPFHGRHYDSSQRLVFPDLRDRTTIGTDTQGQPTGGAGLLDSPNLGLGQKIGKGQIDLGDLPPHHHWLRLHDNPFFRVAFGDTGSTVGLVAGATSPNRAALATLDALYALFSDQAATEDTPATAGDQSLDSRMQPSYLVYKAIRVA